jgi:ribonucleoside-triphosphate reductase
MEKLTPMEVNMPMSVESSFKKITKRDGSEEGFDFSKIVNAINKAGMATGEFGMETSEKLASMVLNAALQFTVSGYPSVEMVQDIVEDVLISSPYKKSAKAFILYRDEHARIREVTSKFNVNLVDQYINNMDWQVKENSNMGFSLQGLNNYLSSEVSKIYWLNKIYTNNIKEAHLSGDLHIHDLGIISAYCVGWDLQDLLMTGFKGVRGKSEAKPAKHLRTALGQIVNFFYTLQGEAAGAQAFSNFDTLLAPFIYYDGLDHKAVKQALQEFLFNVNVPTRVGFQTPFTNITLDLAIPSYFKDQPVIIGGEAQPKTYKEFANEMDMFNRAFLEVMLEGDAKGRVFTFPIPTYNISKDFNWDDPKLSLLWEVTAKYGIPYFANFVNSDMSPEDARSMCCRLRIDNRELRKRGGGLFGSSPLTGSIGVVTINMPRIGYLSKDEDEFFIRLDRLMRMAKASLRIKRKILEQLTEHDLYPYVKFYLRNIHQRFGEYWKNHFSTIGLTGMNEACLNFLGEDIGSDRGRVFALKVMDFMRNKLVEFQKETGDNYNLEATPAEGTSYRLAKLDKEKYPGIIDANKLKTPGRKPPFYTNSTQLPVDYTDDIFRLLSLQDDLQAKYTGGTVQHLFIGEKISDTGALKSLIRKICEKFHLPYFSITPTFSVCPSCGYMAGEVQKCHACGSACEVYSRIVGYLRPVTQWNEGKQAEFAMRKTAKI